MATRPPRPCFAAFLSLLLLPLLRGQELALKGFDPIDLAAGTERSGSEDLTSVHGRFRYRFATAANLETFRADPERHAIQFGGACARMGPLSGGGDPARWLVHDGRLFVFASDDCRKGFQKRPALFLEADLEQPPADPAGAALLARAVAAHGGAERLRAWRSYAHEHRRTEGDTTEIWRTRIVFPDRFRGEHDYLQGGKQWRFADVVTGGAAFQLASDEATPMHATARREAERRWLLEPVVALRLALDRPHVATAKGKAVIDDVAVEQCELWLGGATVTLGLGPDGRIRTLQGRARGPQLWFGDLVRTFDDLADHDGILLPQRVRATFDGKPAPSLEEQRQDVAVDGSVAEDLFAAPR